VTIRCPAVGVRFAFALVVAVVTAFAGPRIGFQGRLQIAGTNHVGPASFKFALVPETGGPAAWLSSADLDADGQPDVPVVLVLERGIFALSLGDTNLPGMSSLSGPALGATDLAVRVWFRTGTNSFTRLLPDQPLSTVGHALRASGLEDGAVTSAALAPELQVAVASVELLRARMEQLAAESRQLQASLVAVSNSVQNPGSLAGLVAASMDPADGALRTRGFERFESFPAPDWQSLPASPAVPSARSGHVLAWGGGEWLIWGGLLGNGGDSASGAAFNPSTGGWRTFTSFGAPTARAGAASAVSATGLFVWGGFADGQLLGTGGLLDFGASAWTPVPIVDAPIPRDGHVATWTGSRFLVWGGRGDDGLHRDGGSYDPVTRIWTSLPTLNAPSARIEAHAVWTGSGWIVWGGSSDSGRLGSGAILKVDSQGVPAEWTPMATNGAPSPRTGAAAIWTGSRLLVWGGQGESLLGDGASYDPVTDRWTVLPTSGAPSPRSQSSAAWTGNELVVVAGQGAAGVLSDGAAFNPATGLWRSLSNGGSAVARSGAGASWNGTALLLFGGIGASGPVAAPQQVEPRPAWHLFRKP
jgi:hypothetical protein